MKTTYFITKIDADNERVFFVELDENNDAVWCTDAPDYRGFPTKEESVSFANKWGIKDWTICVAVTTYIFENDLSVA